MKVEDLMLADWVCTEHDSTPRQIDWIRTGEVGLLWNKVATPPYLVPIPLTLEILEKNGWEHKWWWVHPSTCICFQEKITGDFRVMPNTECDKRDWFATIKYVHELQHLYKLCGIEKEIVL